MIRSAAARSALLCMGLWMTCAKRRSACAYPGKRLGIAGVSGVHGRPVTWDNSICALCIN